jgi:hypothetical protein
MSKSIDTIATLKTVAGAIYNGVNALSIINHRAAEMREAGIKFGKSKKTCQYRQQFADAMEASFGGKKEKTYANYVTAFVASVNEGIEFSFSHSKGKSKGKKKSDADASIYPVLAKLFSHQGFTALMSDLQESYHNDEGSLSDLVRVILESEGYEIKD